MIDRLLTGILVIAVGLASPSRSAAADTNKEALVERVRSAIDRGVQFLRDQEKGNGHWELDGLAAQTRPGGFSSLAMLALLNAGVKPDDPIIDRGLKFLRPLELRDTYVVGLQTMVFATAGRAEDKVRIQRNVDWLVNNAVHVDGELRGWGYGGGIGGPDNSNTQYALLGLHDGHQAGAKIDRKIWKEIQDFYIHTQNAGDPRGSGGWGYQTRRSPPTLTMTTAGLCGLLIAGMELNEGRETINPDGIATGCGIYQENRSVASALGWVGRRFTVDYSPSVYYSLYGLERAGRLTGQRFLGSHDWYREGCEFLVSHQSPDGYWVPGHGHDNWPIVATSFSLLFLSKGRTPILISKLEHGPGDDWNNDHSDAKHLAEYASKELFKNQPLAWQIFDPKRGLIEANHEEMLNLVGDLMQSPIAYFNGHHEPRFSPAEEELLKEYIEQGGFILAEACCGRAEFDRGFRDLMRRLFPDTPLKPLPPEHPIWKAHALVRPDEFKLEGIERGCKTVVVYSPQDLSCLWEANKQDTERGKLAFRLGANIVAYATGLELPKPRLTDPQVIRVEAEEKKIPRGYLKVAQLRHEGDWQPAPRAMRNLMAFLQDKPRLPVAIKTEPIQPSQESVLDFKFLYLHGRNNFNFDADERAMQNLRTNLQTGGLLLADACCGKKAFDTSFRAFAAKLFPDKKLEPIPLNDELFSKELNGEAITTVRCRRQTGEAGYQTVAPFLEGIKVNNRWVVIYSKYDLGCALEKHQSTDCLGHDYASALRLGAAAVLYAMNR